MKRIIGILSVLVLFITLTSCTENYSNGERIGYLSKFSKKGWICKTYEGDLTLSQTGMNNGKEFEFSIDRDVENPKFVAILDSAANYGWKLKITYHQVKGWNWFSNRGETNFFVSDVVVLDKSTASVGALLNKPNSNQVTQNTSGKVIHDTIYVVICKSCK